MAQVKLKIFDTKVEALELANQITIAINSQESYTINPMYNNVTGKFAIKLKAVYETEIVSVIGQTEFDNAVEIVHYDPEWNSPKPNA